MNCSVLSYRVLLNPFFFFFFKWPHWLKYTRAAHAQGRCHTVWMRSVKGSSNLINDRGREADIWQPWAVWFSNCYITSSFSHHARHNDILPTLFPPWRRIWICPFSSWGDRCLKGMNTREFFFFFSTKRQTNSFCNRTNSIVTFKKKNP